MFATEFIEGIQDSVRKGEWKFQITDAGRMLPLDVLMTMNPLSPYRYKIMEALSEIPCPIRRQLNLEFADMWVSLGHVRPALACFHQTPVPLPSNYMLLMTDEQVATIEAFWTRVNKVYCAERTCASSDRIVIAT